MNSSSSSAFRIIRHNGAVVGFDPQKISTALTKAYLAIGGKSSEKPHHTVKTSIRKKVNDELSSNSANTTSVNEESRDENSDGDGGDGGGDPDSDRRRSKKSLRSNKLQKTSPYYLQDQSVNIKISPSWAKSNLSKKRKRQDQLAETLMHNRLRRSQKKDWILFILLLAIFPCALYFSIHDQISLAEIVLTKSLAIILLARR